MKCNMRLRLGPAFLLLLGISLGAAAPIPLAVAAAADLRGTLEELAEAFQKTHPVLRVQISYGASGGLTAQIRQGAPFDVFLSADMGYPEQLVQAGFTTQQGVVRYATGKLMLWVRREVAREEGMQALSNPVLRRIALANPRLAPYGRAAEEALRRAGLYEAVEARLVFAENVAQAAQYLQTGAADAGFISEAQARQPGLIQGGNAWAVPEALYGPLQQGAVVLARSAWPREAQGFLDYLLSRQGQEILGRHGFGRP
jgi:molybdate transport system substrate-binding protein